jgi:hypothetical protein
MAQKSNVSRAKAPSRSSKQVARADNDQEGFGTNEPVSISPKLVTGPAAVARKLIDDNNPSEVAQHAELLTSDRESAATQAARVLGELVAMEPSVAVPAIESFAAGITSKFTRVVSAAAESLPVMAKVAPARVARHLDQLTHAFGNASPVGKEGLVRTFVALCAASVAYQKRLEPVIAQALTEADPKTLLRWAEVVLPALKGEPHARARAVVESRLQDLPRPSAQKVAAFLGVRLRAAAR